MDNVYGDDCSCSFELSWKRTENVGVQNGGEFDAGSRYAGWQIVLTVLSLLLRNDFLSVCLFASCFKGASKWTSVAAKLVEERP